MWQVAEAALADEWVKAGDRLALQRRVLRLGKPPRRWRRPPWAAAASWDPPLVTIVGKPLASVVGASQLLDAVATFPWCPLSELKTEPGTRLVSLQAIWLWLP